MSTHKKANDIEVTVEEIKYKTSNAIEKNQKTIVAAVAIVAIAIAGFFGYKYFVKEPQESTALSAISTAQGYFAIDSFRLALEGDGVKQGFLNIASGYSSTKAGNLAHYYAGICYLNLKQPQEALGHFEKFNGHGTDFEQANVGLMASAHYELGNADKALELYRKAIAMPGSIFTPQYLRAASVLLSQNGNNEEAIKYEKRIKDEYGSSMEARDADRYLATYGSI